MLAGRLKSLLLFLGLVLCLPILPAHAQFETVLRGTVTDPLGNLVPNAKVVVLQEQKEIAQTNSDANGSFTLRVPTGGRYKVHVEAATFASQNLESVFVASGKTTELNIPLKIGPLTQQVVVSATGITVPDSQVGASVTVIDNEQIQTLDKLDLLENLRLVPGAQVVQTSQRGGLTSLFIRGGDSDFNKVLIDGIPVNRIGGAFDFAQVSNAGVGNLEVLRGSNSVLYGSDALSGIVNITSERGATRVPELKYSVDGGNFGSFHQDVSLSGAIHGLDYSSEFSRFDTQGSFANNYFHNGTVNANVGWQLSPTTELRATVRHTGTGLGTPNGLDLFGISDDSFQTNHNTYAGVTAQNQTTEHWHNSVQFSYAQFALLFENPSPTGEPFDPFAGTPFDSGPNFLGKMVTIRGANGFSVTGQGILDSSGTYPVTFANYEARRSVFAQSDYHFSNNWTGIVGLRYEHENGEKFTRNNVSSSLEAHGSIGHRFFTTVGVGLENNSFFGFAATPRVSMAYYLRRPTNNGLFGETKLKFNFGQGIKEASTSQQSAALINLLAPDQIAQFNVQSIGPERSRTFDFGLEQKLWNGKASLGVTLFDNRFYDLIAFLDPTELISIGVPAAVANNTVIGGAYVNATSERTKGAEIEYKMDLSHGVLFQGEYTYLDGVVTKAFGPPVFNPLFPTIPIGAFSPLEGARPFRRAPHSGSLAVLYNHKKFSGALTGYLVSRRDDSTFVFDGFFGNTLLLPNRNLAPAYQKFDVSVRYALKPYLSIFTSVENLFSQRYAAAFGFPAAPFTIRSGLTFRLGGVEGWPKF